MTKKWKLKSGEGKVVEFYPIFEVTKDGQDAECKVIKIKIDDKEYTLNFVNIFQFIYFICNEELRQGLALRYQRRVNYIPYDVNFKLDEEEIKKGWAKRRINLPIDELSMAVARNEGWKYWIKNKLKLLPNKGR
jgi:hypothetical protein